MPIVPSTFAPPLLLRPAWLQTIAPRLLRAARRAPHGTLEALELPDGDTLSLAWYAPQATPNSSAHAPRGLVVLTHGLEGSYKSGYIVGLVRTLTTHGYLVLAWNMRGCGGVPNKLPSWYHSGKSDDLGAVLDHAHARHPTLPLFAIGISVGGNILCKYLGERAATQTGRVRAAIAVSAPLDLRGSAEVLAHPSRRLYMEYLLRPLRARMREKATRFPGLFSTDGLDSITTFHEFDARYTAPLHGFDSVDHYWDSSSGLRYLSAITTPLLIITARDDPFLSPSCFPERIANQSQLVTFEAPRHGGHVGFIDAITPRSTWLERRVVGFVDEHHLPFP